MSMLKQFKELKSLLEQNEWFNKKNSERQVSEFSELELWDMLEISFLLFKHNFESNNYDEYELISEKCQMYLTEYLNKIDWVNTTNIDYKIDFIIDIVCFIYELTYKYDEKMQVLKNIVEKTEVSNDVRIRSLENILSMAKEGTFLDDKEYCKYSVMYDELMT